MNEQHASGTEKRWSQTDTPCGATSGALGQRGSAEDAGESVCPLHFAMRQLAQTAVSQLILYAEGEFAPRPDLLDDLERWQRLHDVIARQICPVSRATGSVAKDLDAALALIPEPLFSRQREMLARCAQALRGEDCPLESAPDLRLFAAN